MAAITNTLIFGGSGKVARHITRLLSAQANHTVHSVIRQEAQRAEIEALGGQPVVQSIEDSSAEDMAATMKATNASTVIWSAGAGGGSPARTRAVDHEGAVRSMDAAALAGVKRYIMVSAVDVRDKDGQGEAAEWPEWYDDDDMQRSDQMWSAIGAYMRAKFAADKALVTGNGRRGLEYTIVRPGRLLQDAGRGTVAAGKVRLGGGGGISREDVAAVVVECVRNEGTVGLAFDVVGGETKIEDAVAEVAKNRVDTFEGRY